MRKPVDGGSHAGEAVALLLAVALGGPQGAIAGEVVAAQVWRSSPANATLAVALGDVDRDGYLDLVSGNIDQPVFIHFGRPDSMLGAIPVLTDSSRFTTSIALGDVDGDGDLDLVCGNLSQPNNLYRNDGGVLRWAWSAQSADVTRSVALADVDDDGRLDLVCGNEGGANTVYLNRGADFDPLPACSVGVATDTRAVAVGDLDGDGRLDLFFGNAGQASYVHLNQGGTFLETPSCSVAAGLDTRAVALGDVDGDGELDLVCGNHGSPSTLHLNAGGGAFSDPPSWTSGSHATTSVALGDLDRDARPDLVLGNDVEVNVAYLNQGASLFGVAPACSTVGVAVATYAVALGDLDGDGDPELVCGNFSQPNNAYGNESDPFSSSADWISVALNSTAALAAADVTGDGLPDLVCGNNGPDTFYRNDGSGPETVPAWTSAIQDQTTGIALGDLDGDGMPDLACSNAENPGQANTVYFNSGGSFPTQPVFLPGQPRKSAGVAMGDVDGDGDPDLAFGNAGEIDLVFRNDGAVFDSAWASADSGGTQAVALADLDDDGLPDLVFGSTTLAGEPSPNNVYLNGGGVFPPLPSFTLGEQRSTRDVAVGDVDGDGDPDLVCGNFGQGNTLYSNVSGVLDPTEVWSSGPGNGTNGVALGDVDGDGRLDLACANQGRFFGGAPNTVYLNEGTRFTTTPSWSSAESDMSTSVILHDLDADGDLDLVFGNSPSAPNRMHRGRRNPPYRGDPAAPTLHQPNNAAFLRSLSSRQAPGTQLRTIHFDLVDVESDPAWLIAEYQFAGQPVWLPVEPDGGPVGPFSSSPAGVPDSLLWDLATVAFDRRDMIVRLKVLETPSRSGLIRHIPSASLGIGPAVSVRPEVTTSSGTISFPTMTVGDSAGTVLEVRNTGSETLVVTAIRFPSPEMRSQPAPPLTLVPGTSAGLTVFLEPRLVTAASGPMEIDSNDPASPTTTVQVLADVRSLDFEIRLLTPGPSAPLGEALTAVVTPDPGVGIDRGAIHYRARSDSGAAFHVDSLSAFGGDFIATIPGDRVKESGLDYFVEVVNGTLSATDPPDTATGLHYQSVAAPAGMVLTPRPVGGGELEAGAALVVEVTLPQGSEFVSGVVRYREGGQSTFDSTDVSLIPAEVLGVPVLGALVPAARVTERGVGFEAEVRTTTSVLTTAPGTARVSVPFLGEPGLSPARRYRMVSVPLEFPGFSGSLEPVLADQPEFGAYDPTRWRTFRYVPAVGRNVELSDTVDPSLLALRPGRAFWLICAEPHRIDTSPIPAVSTSPVDPSMPRVIALEPGWNMIANPFAFPVAWASVGGTGSPDLSEPVRFDPALGEMGDYAPVPASVLMPFEGYFVRNAADTSMTLTFVDVEAAAPRLPAPTAGDPDAGWTLRVRASAEAGVSGDLVLGVHREAVDGLDSRDREQPPPPPGRSVFVSIENLDWPVRPGLYRSDFRGWSAEGHSWIVQARSAERGADLRLEVEHDGEAGPAALGVVDLEQGVPWIPDGPPGYRMVSFGPDRPYRFAILAGSEEFVARTLGDLVATPSRLSLEPNAPNPFRGVTRIRFGLPQPGPTRLEVYDVLGRRVRTLVDARRLGAGFHVAIWDGRDEGGLRVASGVYFCRLRAADGSLRRKMTVLR